mmetsp:Transcript_15678/g.25772  ORF Transcript_15678/g.25772 Transcript_15678/m.25772 type:complete len:91 (+) Transcript_15678:36-308(+)
MLISLNASNNVGTIGESLRQRMRVYLHLPTKHQNRSYRICVSWLPRRNSFHVPSHQTDSDRATLRNAVTLEESASIALHLGTVAGGLLYS